MDSVSLASSVLNEAELKRLAGDPWRESTVSADGATTRSTNEQPIAVGDGFHCSDLITENGSVDPTVLAVQQRSLTFMKTWLEGFKPTKPGKRSFSPRRKST